MKFRPAVVGPLLAACLATPILGQGDHPNRAAGISAQTLYSSSGSDDINLFNGNLHDLIPIGEPVAVGPLLSIAPALVYNSQAEKVWRVCKENEEHPTGDRAIGPGWRLHFGRLGPVETRIPRGSIDYWQPSTPEAPLVDDAVYGMGSTRWAYEDTDGGIHEFYDRLVESSCSISDPACEPTHPPKCFGPTEHGAGHCFAYTHDGSFLRLDPIDPEHGGHPTVYFPDGTFRVMGFRGGRYPILGTSLPTDLDHAETVPAYHTTLAGDLFGNQYSVQYYGDGTQGSPANPLLEHSIPENQWDAIPFRVFPSTAGSDAGVSRLRALRALRGVPRGHLDPLVREGFVVAVFEGAEGVSGVVDEDALDGERHRSARPEALPHEACVGGADDPGLLEAELGRHGPFHGPQEEGVGGLLRSEGLVGVEDLDAVGAAYELVVASLVGVLGSAPAADVADEDGPEVRLSLDVPDETLESVQLLDAFAGGAVAVDADDFVPRFRGV
ncbi:MAG TPA: hypothetical protein PLP50_04955 [Thermoanaerobaculia bacterium]|nr:hypothetical protein [Thermoanaerobaculia bacterium]HPA50934.1 hypothetical protein [Thermoanaerobaculia bacterium]HQN08309.1 hypothetical protein [Thermoanaerobaculia bacterium]HQP88668.1 hypothetical protein [Thermoanaerobaculia bacterium]